MASFGPAGMVLIAFLGSMGGLLGIFGVQSALASRTPQRR